MIFKTELIDSKWNNRWLDGILKLILLPFLLLIINQFFKWWESISIDLTMLSIYIYYTFYAVKRRKHYKRLGELELNRDGLVITQDKKTMIYNWAALKHIQLNRGCRPPTWDNIPNYSHSNYVEFLFQNLKYKFEFSIKTQKDHLVFEALIQELYDQGISIDYKSV